MIMGSHQLLLKGVVARYYARIQRLLSEFPIDKIETFNEVQAAFYDVGCSLYASENDK